MKGFFITGTDTGVGKTLTAAILTLALKKAYYWKPIQTGLEDEPADSHIIQKLTGLTREHFFPSTYQYQASASPHYAASKEKSRIDLATCLLPAIDGTLIVEGAGGVFVPINEQHSLLDLMQQLLLPVIIVCRGTLGTINHTLLTIEALRRRNIAIHGVVFNGELTPHNQTTIEHWAKLPTLFHIPNLEQTPASIHAWVELQKEAILRALK